MNHYVVADKNYAIKLVFKWVNKNGSYDNPIESEL